MEESVVIVRNTMHMFFAEVHLGQYWESGAPWCKIRNRIYVDWVTGKAYVLIQPCTHTEMTDHLRTTRSS